MGGLFLKDMRLQQRHRVQEDLQIVQGIFERNDLQKVKNIATITKHAIDSTLFEFGLPSIDTILSFIESSNSANNNPHALFARDTLEIIRRRINAVIADPVDASRHEINLYQHQNPWTLYTTRGDGERRKKAVQKIIVQPFYTAQEKRELGSPRNGLIAFAA